MTIQSSVEEFHKTFSLPAPDENTLLTPDRREQIANLIIEEANELKEAETPESQLDALTDILYLAYGTAVEMGLSEKQVSDAFYIVHQSNMKKLGPEGKPIYRDGKLLKPDGWQPPNLKCIFKPKEY